jgi:hypothetical protein
MNGITTINPYVLLMYNDLKHKTIAKNTLNPMGLNLREQWGQS